MSHEAFVVYIFRSVRFTLKTKQNKSLKETIPKFLVSSSVVVITIIRSFFRQTSNPTAHDTLWHTRYKRYYNTVFYLRIYI